MSKRIWHKGPPPHVGWWNATSDTDGAPNTFSWWDGRAWSLGSQPDAPPDVAADRAKVYRPVLELVEWTNYWPENARVTRVDPRVIDATKLKSEQFAENLIQGRAQQLVKDAELYGLNVTIERRPLQPLDMGHTQAVVNVWPKRMQS